MPSDYTSTFADDLDNIFFTAFQEEVEQKVQLQNEKEKVEIRQRLAEEKLIKRKKRFFKLKNKLLPIDSFLNPIETVKSHHYNYYDNKTNQTKQTHVNTQRGRADTTRHG